MNGVSTRWGDTPWPDSTPSKKKIHDATLRGQHDVAIKAAFLELQKATRPEIVAKWKKKLGHAYCGAKQYDRALNAFQSIEEWQKNPKVVQAVAIAHSKMGNHSKALQVLQANWQEDDGMLGCKAIIHEKLKQYDQAESLLQRCKKSTVSMGRCYESMKKFRDAIESYKKALPHERETALQNMGRCYANMNDLQKAEKVFEQLVRSFPHPLNFVTYGMCYQSAEQFDKAIAIFKRHPNWKTNTPLLIAIGCCLEQAGRHDAAIEIFQMIQNWEENSFAILSFGRCYDRKKEWVKAEETFKLVPNWHTNVDALLCLARVKQLSLESRDNLQECHSEVAYYIQLIPKWRASKQAMMAIIWLYIRALLPNRALFYLNSALSSFPDVLDFYRLQATFYSLNEMLQDGIEFILEALKKFPNDTVLVIRLLEFYLRAGNNNSARHLEATYRKRFSHNEQFLQTMQETVERFTIQGISKEHEKYTYVELPSEITRLFKDIGEEKIYLVGSTLLNLLTKDVNSQNDRDVDFATNDEQLGASLVVIGFSPIGFVPGLYRKKGSCDIDLMLSDMRLTDESEPLHSWIHDDSASRDFTICALYCNHQGKVFDPTGRGLQDVKEKKLATVADPALCFQQDPTCIFRGLKYMGRGFTPTDDVQKAIREWAPNPQAIAPYLPHMAAVIRKLIRTNSNLVNLLSEYGLRDKLLALFTHADYPDIQANLTPKQVLNFRNAVTNQTLQHQGPQPMRKPQFVTLSLEAYKARYVQKK